MSRCFNPLPRILEERETSSEQQLPEVWKVSWTAHNISQEWLKRMSSIISVKSDIESINCDVISASKYDALKHRDISRRSRKCHDYISTVGSPKEAGSNSKSSIEETLRRKPDSMYISLVSRSTNEVPVLPSKSQDRLLRSPVQDAMKWIGPHELVIDRCTTTNEPFGIRVLKQIRD